MFETELGEPSVAIQSDKYIAWKANLSNYPIYDIKNEYFFSENLTEILNKKSYIYLLAFQK